MAVGGRKSSFSDSFERGCDFIYDYTCSPCISDDKNREAVKFCVDCGEYLCGSCLGDHNKFVKMRSHQMVDPAKYDSRLMAPKNIHVPPLITAVCEKHHGKVLDMFCGEHNEVCCAACLALDHSICKNRHYIPDIASGLNGSSEYKQLEKENEKVFEQLETTKQKRFADMALHKHKKEEILASLKQCREQVIKRYDELEQRTVRLVEKKYQQSETAATNDVEKIDKTLDILKSNNVQMTNEKSNPQKFVLLKTAEKDLDCARNVLQNVLSSKPMSLEFYFNEKIKKCFTDLSVLGSFQEDVQRCSKRSDLNVHGGVHVDIHSVQDKDEKSRCSITGLCKLDDGNLLVADVANSSIKRLGPTFKILDICKLSSQPWSLCAFGDEVAVSMCNAKTIQLVTLKGILQMSRSFPVKDACAGLASCGETLYVGLIKRKQIQTYDRSGYPLKSIDLTLENTCFIPWSIAITPCETLLYVATRDNVVLAVDAEMKTCRKVDIPDLKCASCVVLSNAGNLLVSCKTGNKVIHFAEGKSGILLDKADGIESPKHCVAPDKNSLLRWRTQTQFACIV